MNLGKRNDINSSAWPLITSQVRFRSADYHYWTEDDYKRLTELTAAGGSYASIGRLLGRSREDVRRKVNDIGRGITARAGRKSTWSKVEVETAFNMRENGEAMSTIAKAMGCTRQSVSSMFHRHDKSRKADQTQSSGDKRRYSRQRHWSQSELDRLRDYLVQGYSNKKIGALLDRSEGSVKSRRARDRGRMKEPHKLSSSLPWTEAELALLRKLRGEGTSVKNIATLFPQRTFAALQMQLWRLSTDQQP